ncbi:unnamed protein product, partial [marine sediment metagenome]
LRCGYNQLTDLDLSNCDALTYLDCKSNQLSFLNVSNNKELTTIRLGDMPTLFGVCVWIMPFPPEGVNVNTIGSPNFYYTDECAYFFVRIPDTDFLNALIEKGVDIDGDSLISYAEAASIVTLDVSNNGISDLTGIRAFINLDTLICSNNSLSSLDLAKNRILKYLDCSGCGLQNLDISNNKALKELFIEGMPALHEVCVWITPFPPDGVEVHTYDSPIVIFTTECFLGEFLYVPDTAFLRALIEEGVDIVGDSLISYAEAASIVTLDVSNNGISDLTGIRA